MKLYQKISMIALGAVLITNSATFAEEMDPRDEAFGREIAAGILEEQGMTRDQVADMLADPSKEVGKSSVCSACEKVEKLIGDPNTNCGGHSNSFTCGVYIGKSLFGYVKKNKTSICKKVTAEEKAVCNISKSLADKVFANICKSEGFKKCAS